MSISTALLGIAALSCLMSAAVLGSLFQSKIPGVHQWSVASGLLAVTATLLLLQRSDVVVLAGSALLVGAALLALHGFRQFFRQRSSITWEYGAIVAILAGLVYWTYILPDVNARAAVVSGFIAYVRFGIGWLVQRYRPAGRPKYSYHFVTVAAVLGAIVHAVRCVAYAFGLAHETTFLEATPINVAFVGLATLTLPCLSLGMVMLAHDRLAEQMERLATIDDLTGVLGRRAFIARAEALFDVAKAEKSKLSIAILDIDHFKSINDGFGHAAGDRALAHIASLLSHETRQTDVVGRIGGEEFALLLPRTGKEEAAHVTDRLRGIVSTSVSRDPTADLVCTVSAGVEEFDACDSLASVMARADAALYAAKADGRNRVMLVGENRQFQPVEASA